MTHSVFYMLIILMLFAFHPQQQVHALSQESDQDFRYMDVVYNATDLSFSEEYDYVVVGGGTTGCSLAATLSEKHSVLLLERGKPRLSYPFLVRFITREEAQGLMLDFNFFENVLSEEGVEILLPFVLGGRTVVAPGAYSRASSEYFDSSSDIVKWDHDLVRKAYEWVEEDLVYPPGPQDAWQSAIRDAFLETGIVPDNGFTLDYKIGTRITGTLNDQFRWRHGADELLSKGDFQNLRVAVEASVQRVIFSSKATDDGVPKARGVIYTDSYGYFHRAFARREVILSAGALASPKILLLSGVGPEPYLSSQGIPVVYPQPNVGNFMSDNLRIGASIIPPFPQNDSEALIAGITEDYIIQAYSVNFLVSPNPVPFSYFPRNASSLGLDISFIFGRLVRPMSKGTLRLGSPTNVSSPPKVRFNYFSDPEDLSNCARSARKIREILDTGSVAQFGYKDLRGGTGFSFFGATFPATASDDVTFEDYCRNTFATYWGYQGGCLVGKVIDGDFRVIGTEALRVVDSSVFAESPGPDQLSTGMMLGRYVGQQILRETKSHK